MDEREELEKKKAELKQELEDTILQCALDRIELKGIILSQGAIDRIFKRRTDEIDFLESKIKYHENHVQGITELLIRIEAALREWKYSGTGTTQ